MNSEFNEVDAAVRDLIREMTELERPVKMDDRLIDDLALSSIDMVEIATALRKKFGIDVSLQNLSSCVVFEDLLSLCLVKRTYSADNSGAGIEREKLK
ncbi:acyl carrier protein [Xanthomonas translucens]|uniref:acyl carrier protein n=1 Tax=Xanthomonas campestris pv. translucens TaxID=343 RepID=UPI002729F7CA|nr:acyl carrier protein [Xanthomonas translucens]WLA12150.1 acyl carrier protein [Xanthomonas translucens]